MTSIERIIAILRSTPQGVTPAELRAAMGWPNHRQIGPYLTAARRALRMDGLGETIPYRRLQGGDKVRLISSMDMVAALADDEQSTSARTRVLEVAEHYRREGDLLTAAGQNRDAVVAYSREAELRNAAALV